MALTRDQAEQIRTLLTPVLNLHTSLWQLCGSFRRGKQTDIGDLDFVVTDANLNALRTEIEKLKGEIFFEKTVSQGNSIFIFLVKFQEIIAQVDVNNVPKESFGAALIHSTGSGKHNVGLRTHAKQRGFRLNQYGLTTLVDEKLTPFDTEEALFNALGFKYIAPECRIDFWKNRNQYKLETQAQIA
jgi:DNA polymerase (family X)